MSGDTRLDRLARALAEDEMPRRQLLGRLGGVIAAVVFTDPVAAVAAGKRKKCKHGHVACGNDCCAPGEVCHTVKRGRRVHKRCACSKPRAVCGGQCIDLASNAEHCGTCGKRCAPGEACHAGKCATHAECVHAGDCPQAPACHAATCVGGVCGTSVLAEGTACGSGAMVCDGSGTCVGCNTAEDCPATGTPCATATCANGACGTVPAARDTPCGTGNAMFCDGAGTCVGCNTASECPPTTNPCVTVTCVSGTCGTSDLGTSVAPPALQTAGTCQKIVCNGSGGTTSVGDPTNGPGPSSSDCQTDPTCSGSPLAPSYTNLGAGTSCSQNGGSVCGSGSAAGTCVQCNTASDCPASVGACVTCTSNTCVYPGTSDAPPSLQTPGDCQKVVCNGSGGVTSEDDSTDIPTSNSACLIDPACCGPSPLTPCFTNAPTGTSCTTAADPSAHVCGDTANPDIAGVCVECNNDNDCLAINNSGSLSCDTATGTCQ
jgi:hypothetical protein